MWSGNGIVKTTNYHFLMEKLMLSPPFPFVLFAVVLWYATEMNHMTTIHFHIHSKKSRTTTKISTTMSGVRTIGSAKS